jgi:hypothetical protein
MTTRKLMMVMACVLALPGSVRAADGLMWHEALVVAPEMMVGSSTLARLLPADCTTDTASSIDSASASEAPPATRPSALDSAGGSGLTVSSYWRQSFFSTIGDVVDFHTAPLPSFDADILYLFVPAQWIQPFWSVARQIENPRDDGARLGFGTGLRWNLTPSASLAAQTLVFPAERANSDLERSTPATTLTEVQFVARLEIKF